MLFARLIDAIVVGIDPHLQRRRRPVQRVGIFNTELKVRVACCTVRVDTIREVVGFTRPAQRWRCADDNIAGVALFGFIYLGRLAGGCALAIGEVKTVAQPLVTCTV